MPTGVALRDGRGQLFDAAERVLVRGGPSALSTRSVTAEAGCATGVLHRHFADFDEFLAELVRDRIARLDGVAESLRAESLRAESSRAESSRAESSRAESAQKRTGIDPVAEQLATMLTEVFTPVAVAVVSLVAARDGLRARLRATTPAGIPLLSEATAMIASYLRDEQDRGRIAAGADVDALAPMLVGTAHLLFADRTVPAPAPDVMRRAVATALAGVVRPARGRR